MLDNTKNEAPSASNTSLANPGPSVDPEVGSTVLFVQDFCARLLALYAVSCPTQDSGAQEREEASTRITDAYNAVVSLVAPSLLSNTDEDEIQLGVAYLYALRNRDPSVRTGLTIFLDNFLAHGAQLDVKRPSVTLAISGHTITEFYPASGAFDDAAPLAAWLAERLSVPVETVHVSPAPFDPRLCREHFMLFVDTALRTKLPETRQADIEGIEPLLAYEPDELPPGESTAVASIVFFASIDIPDASAADAILARAAEPDDGTATVQLPYTFNGVSGMADIEGLAVDQPFRGVLMNAFEDEVDDIREVWKFLRDNNHPADDIGVQFRIDRRLDEKERRCCVDIYSVKSFQRFMQVPGVRYQDRTPFMHVAISMLQAAGVGEVMAGRHVVYRPDAGFVDAPAE